MTPAPDCHGCGICKRCDYQLLSLGQDVGYLTSQLEDLRKTLAEVRAQRDEWEQIATGYRARLQASGVGLSNVSS